jgi:hypothetical protein
MNDEYITNSIHRRLWLSLNGRSTIARSTSLSLMHSILSAFSTILNLVMTDEMEFIPLALAHEAA